MKTWPGLLVTVTLMIYAVSLASQNAYPLRPNPELSLEISAVKDTVKIGAPLDFELTVALTNTSDHDIVVWLSKAGAVGTYVVDVRDEKGNLPADTRYGLLHNGHLDVNNMKEDDWKRLGFTPEQLLVSGGDFPFTLKAGESFRQRLVVTTLYEIKNPGKYSVHIEKYTGGENQSSEKFLNRSNIVTVTVTP